MNNKLLSVIVPVFNEQEGLKEFYKQLSQALRSLQMEKEIVFINDGSKDESLNILYALKEKHPEISIIDFTRNFGKEIAMSAGIDYSKGDVIVIIDADLQHPPELILDFIKYWQEGYDIVYGLRQTRDGESWVKKTTAHYFYRVMNKIGEVNILEGAGDFRLLSRRAADSLKQLREQHRFMKGLFSWVGYSQKAVKHKQNPRYAGKTKWNYWKLWNFALEGITSFTILPLKIASYFGLLTSFWAFVYVVYVIIKTIIYGDPVQGFPSLMVVILFLGGIQLMTLGVIGEYVGRIFNETKNRPLYLLKDYVPSDINRNP